jgi:hypothetical protein
MRPQIRDAVFIPFDREVKAPIIVDTRLPETVSFEVFLGMKRRVIEIASQEIDLFDECLLNGQRSSG